MRARGPRIAIAAMLVAAVSVTVVASLGVQPAYGVPAGAVGLKRAAMSAGVGSNLAEMIAAKGSGDERRFNQLAANGQALWEGERLQLQVHLRPGTTPQALTDAALSKLGGRVGVRAIDVMNVWLPLSQVARFSREQGDKVAFVQLPWRPHFLGAGAGSGPTVSQGPGHMTQDIDALKCVNNSGVGVKVAVIDGGFEKLPASIKAGEAADVEGPYAITGGTHGTMCVEVVADVAPGATIRAITANSYAVLQQFQAEMKMGNPNKIDIVSHSVIWLGMSFGRNEGLACKVTEVTRAQGVAWVNASGNSGAGQFHKGLWKDADNDKKHEFAGNDPTLRFLQRWNGGDIKLTLDWDDYAERKTNIDLYLFRENEQGFLEQVSVSIAKQGPYTPPLEQIIVKHAPKGVYAVVLVAATAVPKNMAFRIVNLGSGASSFSIWHKNGNVYDPASCDGVLTVGAIHHSRYEKGPQEMYSSYGPTPDGRQKPEIMAPTSVSTSVGNFGGTSSACPHAAGALALYKAATSVSAEALVARLIEDAEPMGDADPNDVYGNGRVMLRPGGLGWQCAPDDGAVQPCATPCGTTGTAVCSAACGLSACEPPAEACNGADDDCDGETDEGCVSGAEQNQDDAGASDGAALDGLLSDQLSGDLSGLTDAAAADVSVKPPEGERDGGCAAGSRTPASPVHVGLMVILAALLVRRRRVATPGDR